LNENPYFISIRNLANKYKRKAKKKLEGRSEK
jgi:hypothetical protein